MERRTLIRLLVGLGIGVPVAIEAATFLGLFERRLLDGGDGGPTRTPAPDRVGLGDELLPETPPADTVTHAEVRTGEGGWSFALEVTVTNGTDAPYELRLGEVTTSSGRTVAGGGSTPRVPGGASDAVLGHWTLPEGDTPQRVEAVGISFPPDADPVTVRRSVPLSTVPVSGG